MRICTLGVGKKEMIFFLTMDKATSACPFVKTSLPKNPKGNEIRNVDIWVENNFLYKNFFFLFK